MIEGTFPKAFEQRMHQYLGAQWNDFVAAHNQPPPVSIRINSKKISPALTHTPIPWTSTGYYLNERPSFTLDPIFHGGGYYVQEASSMFLEQAFIQTAGQKESLNILDLCAAPGGKSTHLLSLMNNQSLLVSNEVIRSRASILAENLQKWGHYNVVVTNNDPKDFQRLPCFFDVIVVDAPCSGEGLFRKDPDAMKEWSPGHVILCSSRQQRILKDIWPALKPGGILIYSTCTYNENENEDVLTWLNETQPAEFIALKFPEQWGVRHIQKGDIHGYRLFPHNVRGEGFFISALRKLDDENPPGNRTKNSFTDPSKKIREQLSSWVTLPEEKKFIIRNDQILQCLPVGKLSEIEFLAKRLHIITAGITLASQKHDKLIPDHSLALSTDLNHSNFNIIDLDLSEALQYLRKETITPKDVNKGFALVRFNNLPLGWVNVLDNRINNLYPSEWRIRMRSEV